VVIVCLSLPLFRTKSAGPAEATISRASRPLNGLAAGPIALLGDAVIDAAMRLGQNNVTGQQLAIEVSLSIGNLGRTPIYG